LKFFSIAKWLFFYLKLEDIFDVDKIDNLVFLCFYVIIKLLRLNSANFMVSPSSEIGGYTEQDIKKALWWATHKTTILKIITFILLLLGVALWGYTLYGVVRYFFIDWSAQKRLENGLVYDYIDYEYFREKNKPQNLVFSGVQIYPLGGNRYDLVVKAENVNPNWAVVSIQYDFNFSGKPRDEVKENFILPGQTKYLIDLGVTSDKPLSNVSFELKNIKWRRVTNFQEFQNQALNFTISNTKFTSSSELNANKTSSFSKTNFSVKNNTAYNFWSVGFYIILHQGPSITGINYIVKDYIDSGGEYDLEVTWYQKVGRPDKIEIIPDVNVLEEKVFRLQAGGAGEVK
jgi:hypothetical protein